MPGFHANCGIGNGCDRCRADREQVLEANASEELGADTVGHVRDFFCSVAGGVNVGAEGAGACREDHDAGDFVCNWASPMNSKSKLKHDRDDRGQPEGNDDRVPDQREQALRLGSDTSAEERAIKHEPQLPGQRRKGGSRDKRN
jgi:hypothetical protein